MEKLCWVVASLGACCGSTPVKVFLSREQANEWADSNSNDGYQYTVYELAIEPFPENPSNYPDWEI